jgi:hypothetical protein
MAILWILGAFTVVIWRRCRVDVRPSGCIMKRLMRGWFRQASMAADPVSPEVAPMMISFCFWVSRKWAKSWLRVCRAKSLKARVGPW